MQLASVTVGDPDIHIERNLKAFLSPCSRPLRSGSVLVPGWWVQSSGEFAEPWGGGHWVLLERGIGCGINFNVQPCTDQ